MEKEDREMMIEVLIMTSGYARTYYEQKSDEEIETLYFKALSRV